VCGFILQGPVSRHFNGSRALLASTSLSTSSNGASAAVAGAAPLTKQIKTSSKETGTKTEYSVRVELNSGAVWAVGGLIVFGAGACLLAPQVARLGRDGVIGCIALVIGALGIYKGDMNKLEDKIDKVQEKLEDKLDKVQEKLEGNFKEVLKLLQPLSDDLLVRNALKKK
jgi:type VI protein secretion system component VasK